MGGMNLEYLEVAHKKHQDWNGKYCTLRILNEKRWNSFLKRIEDAKLQCVTTLNKRWTKG